MLLHNATSGFHLAGTSAAWLHDPNRDLWLLHILALQLVDWIGMQQLLGQCSFSAYVLVQASPLRILMAPTHCGGAAR